MYSSTNKAEKIVNAVLDGFHYAALTGGLAVIATSLTAVNPWVALSSSGAIAAPIALKEDVDKKKRKQLVVKGSNRNENITLIIPEIVLDDTTHKK